MTSTVKTGEFKTGLSCPNCGTEIRVGEQYDKVEVGDYPVLVCLACKATGIYVSVELDAYLEGIRVEEELE